MSGIVNVYQHLPKQYLDGDWIEYKTFPRLRIYAPTRILGVGGSGSGKTVMLVNIALQMRCWTKIHIYAKKVTEPLYRWFIDQVRAAEVKYGRDILTVADSLDELPEVEEFDENEVHLLIIDDLIHEKSKELSKVEAIFTRGRKQKITTVFLTQDYFKTPITIRKNTWITYIKQVNPDDLKRVLRTIVDDRPVEEAIAMYRHCNADTAEGCFLVDKTPGQDKRFKYRCGFTPLERA